MGLGLLFLFSASILSAEAGVLVSEPIFVDAPFAECHASTLLEWQEGGASHLLAAWFGGTREGHSDVGIWLSRRLRSGGGWSEPVRVAADTTTGSQQLPTWNPVLFHRRGAQAPIVLFYKVGPNPREWRGELIESTDGGESWSLPRRLPQGILGPIKNKPLELPDGSVLAGSSTEDDGWRVHFERSTDGMVSWQRIGPVDSASGSSGPFGAIQPTLLTYADGRIQALCRSQQIVVVETWSKDGGRHWTPLGATELPNPNAGLDGVTLLDGRQLLVYNHQVRDQGQWAGSREHLNVAVSLNGKDWFAVVELENRPGEYSYPAVIQTSDGKVHITYTWRRKRIQHAVLDPEKLTLRPIVDGVWPH